MEEMLQSGKRKTNGSLIPANNADGDRCPSTLHDPACGMFSIKEAIRLRALGPFPRCSTALINLIHSCPHVTHNFDFTEILRARTVRAGGDLSHCSEILIGSRLADTSSAASASPAVLSTELTEHPRPVPPPPLRPGTR